MLNVFLLARQNKLSRFEMSEHGTIPYKCKLEELLYNRYLEGIQLYLHSSGSENLDTIPPY